MNSQSNLEIISTRILNSPVEKVYKAFADPSHLKNWWGPNGFTNTISEMNVTPGGIWNLIMHGPDGTDYKNKSQFREIIKHKKIVFDHVSGPKYTATVTFERQDNKTLLTWHMLFETKEQFEQVVKVFKADEGLKQNVEKLEEYLTKI